MPIDHLLADKTYIFFSHTIKAQPENMPLLDAMLDKVIGRGGEERTGVTYLCALVVHPLST